MGDLWLADAGRAASWSCHTPGASRHWERSGKAEPTKRSRRTGQRKQSHVTKPKEGLQGLQGLQGPHVAVWHTRAAAFCAQLQYLSTLDVVTQGHQTDPSAIASLARHHSHVTILFADIVGGSRGGARARMLQAPKAQQRVSSAQRMRCVWA